MFVYTAKFSRRRAITAVLILAVILVAIILMVSRGDSETAETASLSAVVKNNEDRVEFLNSLGWLVEDDPIDEQTITIPREFAGVYEKYNELQMSQGFDLSKYSGMEAVRYTYEVLNHPSTSDRVVADIIVYRNRIIAGDIQSTALNGFMQGLELKES